MPVGAIPFPVATVGGGGTPGGADTQIQFNNDDVFGGIPSITWNGSVLALTNSATLTAAGAGGGSLRIGSNTQAAGINALAIGINASAQGNYATVLGRGATANWNNSTAIGWGAVVSGQLTTVVGHSASASGGNDGSAFGYNATVGNQATAFGSRTSVTGVGSVGIGISAAVHSSALGGMALGAGADVLTGHSQAIALGRLTQSTAANRCTIGTLGAGGNDMELQIGLGFAAWGATPPGTQPTKISDPIDLTSAITAISAVIDVLEGAGLAANV